MKTHLLSLLLLLPGFAVAQNDMQHQKDSLRSLIATSEGEDKLYYYLLLTHIYFGEAARDDLKMDTLLNLYRKSEEEALLQKNYYWQSLFMYNTLAVFANRGEYDKIIKLAPEHLSYQYKKEEWKSYFGSYRLLMEAYWKTGKFGKAIQGTKQMYEEAKQKENIRGMGTALYTLATIYGVMGRTGEQEKYLKESLEVLKEDSLLDLKSAIYFHLSSLLLNKKRLEEAYFFIQELEQLIHLYEKISESKIPSLWLNLWRLYSNYYLEQNDLKNVEIYCSKLDSLGGVSDKFYIFTARAKICFEEKQYNTALSLIDKAIELNNGMLERIERSTELKIKILCALNGVNAIYDLSTQLSLLRDSIRSTEFNAQLDELRTIYEVDKITVEKERNRNYFLFALGGCALLAIALGIWIYHSRAIVRKNRGLYLQIKEQDRLAEDLEREREESRKLRRLIQPEATGLPEEDDDIFFERLTILMKEQQLYTNSEIKRQDIAGQIGLSDRRLHDCVKNNTGMSFTDYINSLRLAHSRELLSRLDENLTIEAIALDSGFNSRTTFYRLFNEKYGLSPKQFREFVK